MKHDDNFAAFLSRQPFRAPPPEWKEDILRHAKQDHAASSLLPAAAETTFPPTPKASTDERKHRPSAARLWPSPYAWGGLAAIWLALFGLKLDTPSAPPLAAGTPSLSPAEFEHLMAARQQEMEILLALAAPWPGPPSLPPLPPSSSSDSVL